MQRLLALAVLCVFVWGYNSSETDSRDPQERLLHGQLVLGPDKNAGYSHLVIVKGITP